MGWTRNGRRATRQTEMVRVIMLEFNATFHCRLISPDKLNLCRIVTFAMLRCDICRSIFIIVKTTDIGHNPEEVTLPTCRGNNHNCPDIPF